MERSRRARPPGQSLGARKHSVTYGIAQHVVRSHARRRCRRPCSSTGSRSSGERAPRSRSGRGRARAAPRDRAPARGRSPRARPGRRGRSRRSLAVTGDPSLRATDHQLAELRDPGDVLVPGVPDQRDPPAGPQHTGDLGERGPVVEPVERLRARDDVGRAVGKRASTRRSRSRPPLSGTAARSCASISGERLDRRHAMPESDERARQLPGSGAEVDDVARGLAGEPANRVVRDSRAAPARTGRPPPRTTLLARSRSSRSAPSPERILGRCVAQRSFSPSPSWRSWSPVAVDGSSGGELGYDAERPARRPRGRSRDPRRGRRAGHLVHER